MDQTMRKILINTVLFGFLLLPLILWLFWIIKPSFNAKILLVDKTVLTSYALEHRAFDWVLTHRKYVKPDGNFYSPQDDYFGFFPMKDEKFVLKDLSGLSEEQVENLSTSFDMTYFTDTDGIYYNEWFRQKDLTEHSEKVYGGLDKNDVLFLRKMKEKKKLILAEFNLFATPTSVTERTETEILLGLKWSGWTGRYFEQLDTVQNSTLPKWVVRLYKDQHRNKWPFTKSGIVFVHANETIVILENETDITHEVPLVRSFNYGVEKFNIPEEIRYPYWFDITLSTDTNNRVISYYQLFPNLRGDSILKHHDIPRIFPAAFENIKDSHHYYFCGDFSDSPIHKTTPKMMGIEYLKMFVLNDYDLNDRTPFFWRYYLPMTAKILDNYFKNSNL
jgi:hypothetical protein